MVATAVTAATVASAHSEPVWSQVELAETATSRVFPASAERPAPEERAERLVHLVS
jgi:hypothetical protein